MAKANHMTKNRLSVIGHYPKVQIQGDINKFMCNNPLHVFIKMFLTSLQFLLISLVSKQKLELRVSKSVSE